MDLLGDLFVQLPGDLAVDLFILVDDLAGAHGIDPDDGPADGGLAGAGFAHQTEGLALVNIKGNAVDSHEFIPLAAEGDLHVADAHQHLIQFLCHYCAPPLLISRMWRMTSGGSILGARGSSSQVRALWVGDTSK